MSLYDGISVETAPVPEMAPTIGDTATENKSLSKYMFYPYYSEYCPSYTLLYYSTTVHTHIIRMHLPPTHTHAHTHTQAHPHTHTLAQVGGRQGLN